MNALLYLDREPARRILLVLALALAHFGAALLAFALVSPWGPAAAFWPAAGVLAGGLGIVRPKDRPWLLVGAFASVMTVATFGGTVLERALVFAAANCAGGIFFVGLYRAFGWPIRLNGPGDAGRFTFIAAISGAATAAVGTMILHLVDPATPFSGFSWLYWMLGDFVGVVAAAPPLLLIGWPAAHRRLGLDAILAMTACLVIAAFLFLMPVGASAPQFVPVASLFPFLLWSSIRGSPLANALLALVLSLIATYAIAHGLGPFTSLTWPASRQAMAVQMFCLTISAGSLLMSILFAERSEREARLAAALDSQRALLHEVNHRVKNSLQLVTSVLALEAAQIVQPDARARLLAARSRIEVIARLHSRLYETGHHARLNLAESLGDAAQAVLRMAGRKDVTLVIDADPDLEASIRLAAPLALAVSELVTNAIKHAFPDSGGRIALGLARDGDMIELSLSDDGPGLPEGVDPAASDSLGLTIVSSVIRQVEGTLTLDRAAAGAEFHIRAPWVGANPALEAA